MKQQNTDPYLKKNEKQKQNLVRWCVFSLNSVIYLYAIVICKYVNTKTETAYRLFLWRHGLGLYASNHKWDIFIYILNAYWI